MYYIKWMCYTSLDFHLHHKFKLVLSSNCLQKYVTMSILLQYNKYIKYC